MDVNPTLSRQRWNGTISIESIPRDQWSPTHANHLVAEEVRYSWHPPYQLFAELPPWYPLALRCRIAPDGTRRFSPFSETGRFVFEASVGGDALLADRGEVDQGSLLTYDEARLFNQYARHMREYLGTTSRLACVLNICAGGRTDSASRNILPEDLGLDRQEEGRRWGVGRLKSEGLRAARAAGQENPTPEQILRYGLMEAARRNPQFTGGNEVGSLVRMTLFDLGPSADWVQPEELDYVARQVKKSLKDHASDTSEEFHLWLEDPKSNLLYRIAKPKDCPLSRDQVKRALLEIGWRSFQQLARSLDVQMQAFCEAIPQLLTEIERSLFRQIYLAHPAFDGFPFVVLHDRFAFLKEATLEMWDQPADRQTIAIVRRMMEYYAVLASNRRAADRLYKQRATGENCQGRPAVEHPLLEDDRPSSSAQPSELFMDTSLQIARRRGFDCGFEASQWEASLIEQDAERVVFHICCPDHQVDETFDVSREDFERVAHGLSRAESC